MMSEEVNTILELLKDEIKVLEEANQKAEFRSQDIRQIVLAIKRLNRVEKFLKIPKILNNIGG